MTSSYRMYTVDAFAEKPFSGNPAGVCLLMDAKLDDKQLLQIAAEMRHSETSFVTKHAEYSETNPIFGLRWFTPSVEVNLCGANGVRAQTNFWPFLLQFLLAILTHRCVVLHRSRYARNRTRVV